MKKWYHKNKGLLLTMLVTFLLVYISGFWFMSIIVNKQDLVMIYYETGEVAKGLGSLFVPISLIAISTLIFITSSIILILKTMFPKSNAFNILTLKSDREFLTDLPARVRKEVMKNE